MIDADRLAQIQAIIEPYVATVEERRELYADSVFTAAVDLLAMVRERDAALERVLSACDRIIANVDGHKPPGPPNATREQATAVRIRAAITATEGAE